MTKTSSGEVMGSRQAAELDHAFERNGWTSADVKKLSAGDLLTSVLLVVRGYAEVVQTKHLVDLSADPFVPKGWTVEEHQQGGMFEWNRGKIALCLDPSQQNGGVIEGNKLRKKLKGKSVFNAVLLDWLLQPENQHLIPEEWKGKAVCFWGTIYRRADGGLCVRYLYWDDGRWNWNYYWLGGGWSGSGPALVSQD